MAVRGWLPILLLGLLSCGRTESVSLRETESAAPPPVSPPPVGPIERCSSRLEVEVVGRSTFDDSPRNGWLALGPDGAYFVHSERETPQQALVRIDAESGAPRTVWRDDFIQLIDADDGLVALRSGVRAPDGAPDWRFTVIDADGRALASPTNSPFTTPYYENLPLFVWPVPNLIEGRRVVTAAPEREVGVYDFDTETHWGTLVPGRMREFPVLRWPHLAFASDQRLIVWNVEAGWRGTEWAAEGGFAQVGLLEGLWVGLRADGRPVFGELGDRAVSEPVALGDRTCATVHTDADRALFGCDPNTTRPTEPIIGVRTLTVFDGRNAEDFELDETAWLPRISGRRVAYLTFPPEVDFCSPGGTTGEVVVRDLDTGERVVVSSVTHGCLCCGAYWPMSTLMFEGDLLAWNYDVAESGDADRVPAGAHAIALGRVICGD